MPVKPKNTKKYEPSRIETKWQKAWDKQGLYAAPAKSSKPKYYALLEFPYPSGDGLHVGHMRPYTGMDVIARKRRMQGFNVLFPMGWDAFGLPAENYAVKTGIHPAIITKRNIANFKRQMRMVGFSFDWSREVSTADPEYYKWTQWIFLQFFKAGLAYKARMPINWCPKCKIGLANEEVIAGRCEREGTPVEQRKIEQWMLKITAYAEKLLDGLANVEYLPQIRDQQINWIGKSVGAEIPFPINSTKESVAVFTTAPETIFGATYLVLAPEHPVVASLKPEIKNWSAVGQYIKKALGKGDRERSIEAKGKTGVPLEGIYAINPANKKKMPVWVADYVLGSYGTGVVMGVPAHDERDFEFAKKHNLKVVPVIDPMGVPQLGDTIEDAYLGSEKRKKQILAGKEPYDVPGHLINSGKFTGLYSEDAKWKIVKAVGGKEATRYKLRDWIFSRQRYWGEPIPIINCPQCGYVPVPEKDLPVKLPSVKNFKPRNDGTSPLEAAKTWVNVKCPTCKGPAKRETDVMPNWAGSSWYFLRYIDARNKKTFADHEKLKYWMPVDWYNGGMEHVTLHLLYSRFWNLFLYDKKLVPTSEPYRKRTTHGFILAEDGRKMSKSLGNVVNPDSVVKSHGADTLRAYEMFMGPFDQAIAWNTQSMEGVHRFLHRVWTLAHEKRIDAKAKNGTLYRLIHKTIKQVSDDIEVMGFNTVVSALMIFVNEASKADTLPLSIWKDFLRLLAPLAPHLAEELWAELPGSRRSVHLESWPTEDPEALKAETVTIVIQVNGKVRDRVEVSADITEEEAKTMALARERVRIFVGNATPSRIIYIPGRLINIVV